MNLKKVHHIAIIGSNYEKSKHFYVDLLGFLLFEKITDRNVMIIKLIFNSMR